MPTDTHLPYETARILGDALGVLPGQKTMQTECGRRVVIDRVTFDRPTCKACKVSLVAHAQSHMVALRSLRVDFPDVYAADSEAFDRGETHYRELILRFS